MKELLVTKTLFKGTHLEISPNKTIFWQNSIYSENWQSWTIAIYHKVNDKYKCLGIVPQRDFSREVQIMHDLNLKQQI